MTDERAHRVVLLARTPSGKIELAPEALAADVERLRAGLDRPVPAMVLVGRRDLRSNNSWMRNVEPLMKDGARSAMLLNPADARSVGLTDGTIARVTSRAGTIDVPVEVTDEIMPGVVSIPHGWGHDLPGVELRVA